MAWANGEKERHIAGKIVRRYCSDGRNSLARGAWNRQGKGMAMKFVVCVSREDCGELSTDDLTLGRLYELLAPADQHNMVRVI